MCGSAAADIGGFCFLGAIMHKEREWLSLVLGPCCCLSCVCVMYPLYKSESPSVGINIQFAVSIIRLVRKDIFLSRSLSSVRLCVA